MDPEPSGPKSRSGQLLIRQHALVPLQVLGAAWGRTGTLSVKVALERLGFGPSYHMLEVFRAHPEHKAAWIDAARGADVSWDSVFADYRSAVDWPACAFWRELTAAYPDMKVIVVEREPELWLDSFKATVRRGIPTTAPPMDDLTQTMMYEVVFRRSFRGQMLSNQDLLDQYSAHRDEVIAGVKPDCLLRWSLADGWSPLCQFLGVAEPDEPFPRVNDREDFVRIFVQGGEIQPGPGSAS